MKRRNLRSAIAAAFLSLLWVQAAVAQLTTLGVGSFGANASPFLLYDAFGGQAGLAFNGRVPAVGPAWQTSGTGAGNSIAGAGIMQQLAGGGAALYGFSQFAQVPRRYSCLWMYPSPATAASLPPTYAFANDTAGSLPFLHGESDATTFFLRLGAPPGPTFTVPAWAVASSYALKPGVLYQSELNYDGGTNAAMVMRNAVTGTVLGVETAHDPKMATYAGVYSFAEALDNLLQFNTCQAEPTTSYSFPTLNVYTETTFPTVATPFAGDPGFGGTVTWNSAGSVTIAGSAFPAGGGMTLGSLAVNDTVWASIDITSETGCTGGNPCAFSVVAASGTAITTIQPIPATAGRYQFNFTITTADSNARFLITGPSAPGGVAYSVTISQANIYKNTPATPSTPPVSFTPPAATAYLGPGDVKSGNNLFWGGLRAYTAAIALAGTQKLVNVINTSTSETCDILVAANGGFGLTTSCSGTSNGSVPITFCATTLCSVVTIYNQIASTATSPTQATPAKRPALVFNAQNGLPAMQFTSGSNMVLVGTTMPAQAQPWSVSAVANNTSGSSTYYIAGFGTSFSPNLGFMSSGSAAGYAGSGPITTPATQNVAHSVAFIANSTTSTLVSDGVAVTGNAGTVTLTGQGTSFGIGGDAAATPNGPFTGYVMEVGVWPGAFSSTDYANLCANQQAYWKTPSCTYQGPADAVPAKTVRYYTGTRALSAAVAGAGGIMFNVRNTTTSETCDVRAALNGGPGLTTNCSGTSNNIAYATFCASGCAFPAEYDQTTGNPTGSTTTQATTTKQPGLTISCVNSLPCETYNGSSQYLAVSGMSLGEGTQPTTTFGVGKRTAAAQVGMLWSQSSTILGWNTGANTALIYDGSVVQATATDGVWNALAGINDDAHTLSAIVVNGVSTTGTAGTGGIGSAAGIGGNASGGNLLTGQMTEHGWFTGSLSGAELTALCKNQQGYYGAGNFGASC